MEHQHNRRLQYTYKAMEKDGRVEYRSRRSRSDYTTGEFIIIGGVETKKSGASPIVPMSTERCTLTGDKINCVDVGPWLTNYWSYPEIMHVPHDYCLK